jgi:hypothetical protein
MLIRSCPAPVKIKGPRFLWIRSLLAGDDAMAIIVANDNIACDRAGTVIRPVEQAKLAVQLPTWLNAADVFEVTYNGMKPVKWQAKENSLNVDLETVAVTRFIVVAKDKSLRQQLQKTYTGKCAANVRTLVEEKKNK